MVFIVEEARHELHLPRLSRNGVVMSKRAKVRATQRVELHGFRRKVVDDLPHVKFEKDVLFTLEIT